MELIDKQYLKTPTWGSRSMRNHLGRLGYKVNRKRVQRLMRLMGLEAIYPKCGRRCGKDAEDSEPLDREHDWLQDL